MSPGSAWTRSGLQPSRLSDSLSRSSKTWLPFSSRVYGVPGHASRTQCSAHLGLSRNSHHASRTSIVRLSAPRLLVASIDDTEEFIKVRSIYLTLKQASVSRCWLHHPIGVDSGSALPSLEAEKPRAIVPTRLRATGCPHIHSAYSVRSVVSQSTSDLSTSVGVSEEPVLGRLMRRLARISALWGARGRATGEGERVYANYKQPAKQRDRPSPSANERRSLTWRWCHSPLARVSRRIICSEAKI